MDSTVLKYSLELKAQQHRILLLVAAVIPVILVVAGVQLTPVGFGLLGGWSVILWWMVRYELRCGPSTWRLDFNDEGRLRINEQNSQREYTGAISAASLPGEWCCLLKADDNSVSRGRCRPGWLLIYRNDIDEASFRRLNRVIRLRRLAKEPSASN